MAEGYARASGRVGVAIATSGPGATNLVTAIADAWMDSTPLVCITGQVRANLIGTDAFQETRRHRHHDADRQAFVARPGRRASCRRRSRTPSTSPAPAGAAPCSSISQGRPGGRARLLLPGRGRPARLAAADKVHERQVREAAKAIVEAKQPIVYAGGGVLNADASRELLALVEAARLPAVVTLMGKGCLPDSHPLNYGAPGMHGSKYANWALNKSDLIIAVGARFDDRVTGKVSAFAPARR